MRSPLRLFIGPSMTFLLTNYTPHFNGLSLPVPRTRVRYSSDRPLLSITVSCIGPKVPGSRHDLEMQPRKSKQTQSTPVIIMKVPSLLFPPSCPDETPVT